MVEYGLAKAETSACTVDGIRNLRCSTVLEADDALVRNEAVTRVRFPPSALR